MRRTLAAALPLLAWAAPRPASAQRFEAVLDAAGHSRIVGVLRLDGGRMLLSSRPRPDRDDSSAPGQRRLLHRLTADATAPVGRSDPRSGAALREHLHKYYDVTPR